MYREIEVYVKEWYPSAEKQWIIEYPEGFVWHNW